MRLGKYILGLLMLLSGISVFAQDDDKPAPYKRPVDSYSRDTISTDVNSVKSFQPKKKFDMSKMLIEPNVEFSFSSDYYEFGVMPYIGYNVWKRLYVGATVDYNLKYEPHIDPSNRSSPSISLQVFGAGPFAQYQVWKRFFVRVTPEILAVKYANTDYTGNITSYATRGIPYLWLGGGYNLVSSKFLSIPIAFYVNPLSATYDGTEKSVAPYSWFYLQIGLYIF